MAVRQKIRLCTAHDGVRLAYALSGSGPPLVKVGNWLTHLELDLQSPVWGYLIEALSRDRTLVRYDQRGTGLSDRDVESMTFEDHVRDLETVVATAKLGRFPLLCISQGTTVGIAFAVRHPDRVSHLILHGGAARGRRRRSTDPAYVEEEETMLKLMELGWGKNRPGDSSSPASSSRAAASSSTNGSTSCNASRLHPPLRFDCCAASRTPT